MLACLPIASLIRCWRTWCYLPCFRTMEHLGMKNGASKSLGLLHVLFSLMSSWFWPFGGWYVDVQRNSFLSWRIWELQLQAAERELPHLSQKVLLGEIKSNSVMMSERKSTLSHQWAMSERVSWPNWHLSAGGALPKTRLRKVLCRTLFNHYLVSVNLTIRWCTPQW